MSDVQYRRQRRFRNTRRRQPRRALEPAPYVAGFSAPQDEEGRRNALQTIFDYLGTTGRVVSNLAEDAMLGEWNDPIRRALPWAKDMRRSSMENILFGGEASTGDQLPGLIPVADEKGGGRQILRKGVGFVADVVTDPLTWLTAGGPTAAAKAAARAFATKASQQAVRQLANPKVAQRVFGEAAQKRIGAMKALGVDDSARNLQYQNQVFRDAYREAISTPPATLKKNYVDRLNQEKIRLNDLMENPPGDKKFWAGIRERAQKQVDAIDQDLDWVGKEWDTLFEAVNVRKGPVGFLGMPFWTREGPGSIRENIAKAGAFVRDVAKQNPRSKAMLDAWWSLTNTGVIGGLRNTFGFYNPVGKILNIERIANQKTVLTKTRESIDEIESMFQGVTDDQKKELVDLVMAVDRYTDTQFDQLQSLGRDRTQDEIIDFLRQSNREALQDPGVRAVIQPENQETVLSLYAQTQQLKQRWFHEEQAYAAQGIIDQFAEVDNYLPISWKRQPLPGDVGAKPIGAPTYAPHKARESGLQSAIESESERLSTYFGFTREQADQALQHNLSSLTVDPQAMLRARASVNARIHGRAQLMESMKPWGININETQHMARMSEAMPKVGDALELEQDKMYRALKASYDHNRGDLGLHRIDDKFYEGWLYPTEVANMLTRVVDITGKGGNAFGNMLKTYSRWWSNVVTLSPRYHIRNMVSNFALTFLRHGPEAFNPRMWVAAAAGASQRLKTPASKLTEAAAKITGTIEEKLALGWNVGDHTVDELSKIAYEKGVISKVSYAAGGLAGDVTEEAAKTAKWRVGKRAQDAAFRTSQNVGSIIESSQRFNMFLLNAKKMMRPGKTRLTDAELDFAAMEANKWMVDYSNLTPFERNFLRYVIPFYSWVRHNLPNMVEMVKDNPALFNTALKGEKAMFDMLSGGVTVDRSILPEWMLEMNYMPLSEDEQGNITLGYTGMPWAEMNVLPVSFNQPGRFGIPRFEGRRFFEEMVQRSNPLLKMVVERALKQRTLTGQSLEHKIAVPPGLHGLKADAALPVIQLIDGVAGLFVPEGLGFTDQWGRADLDKKGRLKMSGWAYSMVDNAVPQLKLMASLFAGGAAAADKLGILSYETLEEMDLTDPTKDDYDNWLKSMGFYLGVATTEQNIYEMRKWKIREQQEKAKQRRNYSTKSIRINN